jgi:hypothetical protein
MHAAVLAATDATGVVAAGRRRRVWGRGSGEVRDVLGLRVLSADGGYAGVGGFASFGEGVVA